MKRNVCGTDRTVRLTAGTVLALGALLARRFRGDPGRVAPWQILATYAAGELLVTGLLQWCPGNYLLGVDTCEQDLQGAVGTVRRRVPLVP